MIKVRVRISDNVLDSQYWTIYELCLAKGHVYFQSIINEGAYSRLFLDMSVDNLYEWQRHDPTGEHPEVYHEIYDPRVDLFVDLLSLEDFNEILKLGSEE